MAFGTVQADVIGTSVAGSNIGAGNASIMKNRIINGAMVISQYNGTSSVTPTTSAYVIDRWNAVVSQSSKLSFQQNAGSVTPPTGFSNYLGATSLSTYSVVSTDNFALQQSIEGFNFADLNWGTANAKTVTLSFQVYSSLTGTFGGSLANSNFDYSYPFTYTISSANTWTTISVTIAGPTSGTWIGATNGIGLRLYIALGVGSTKSATAGSWQSGTYFSATGATSVVGTSGATFYITGVQLEVGSSATGFEYRQYGQELALCQRYYEQSYSYGTVAGTATGTGSVVTAGNQSAPTTNAIGASSLFIVPKRTAPTITIYDPVSGNSGVGSRTLFGSGATGNQTVTSQGIGDKSWQVYSSSGVNANSIYYHYTASAEL